MSIIAVTRIAKSLWVLHSALSQTVYIHFVALDLRLLLLL